MSDRVKWLSARSETSVAHEYVPPSELLIETSIYHYDDGPQEDVIHHLVMTERDALWDDVIKEHRDKTMCWHITRDVRDQLVRDLMNLEF